ncbi:MAG: hypothetical protein HUU50_07920 [Candidatus Brocadiae bacterium]|nr:hypothetical protein [Candidatus Brocadiia bacterium]
MIEKKHPRKAASLFMSVLCLALLTVMGLLFFRMTLLFQSSSSSKNAYTYAKLIAEAALQYAIVEIPNVAMDRAYSDPFKPHQFGPNHSSAYQDPVSIPIEHGREFNKPSFKLGEYKVKVNENEELNFSYSLKDQNDALYETYATLKIIDANALLNINAPLNIDPKTTPSIDTLRKTTFGKLLKNLLENIVFSSSFDKKKIPDITDSILQRRQVYGAYKKMLDLSHLREEKVLESKEDLDIFTKYITLHNWANKKALIYGKEEFEDRTPVNLNLAPKALLKAVMQNIVKNNLENLAKEIIQYRENKKGFKNWNEVEKFFLDSKNLTKDLAYKLFANVYPGVLFNDHDPDELHYRPYDKLDLTQTEGTTEFCLYSPGIFHIESLGRSIHINNKMVSRAKIVCNIKLWEKHIVNTQEDFNKVSTSLNAWRANYIELISGKPNEYKAGKNPYFGYLFEGNPEFNTKGSQDDSRVGCAFWFAGTEPKNRRVDGEFMELKSSARGGYPDMKAEPQGKYAIGDKFELWFKPGTNYDGKKIEIMRKCEEGYGGTIITRCAYDPELSSSGGKKSGFVLTRTLVITNTSGGGTRRDNARVFYGKKLNSRGELRGKLKSTGRNLYFQILDALNDDYKNTDSYCVPIFPEERSFQDKFSRKVYGAYGGDANETVSFQTKFLKKTFNWDTMEYDETEIVVTVKCVTSSSWNTAIILSPEPKKKNFKIRENNDTSYTFHKDIFGVQNITDHHFTRTYPQPEETEDINKFPAMDSHNDKYTQSRSERRIYKEAPKPRHWYRIMGSWTQEDIIVESFTLYERKPADPAKREPGKVIEYKGEIYNPGIGGPIHIWRLKDASKYEKGHAHFICHGCTIYQSLSDADWNNVRYKETAFQAKIDCLAVLPKEKQDDTSKIDEGFRLMFGTASWTSFEPLDKKEIVVKWEDEEFQRDGIAKKSTVYLPNPVYKKEFFRKKGGAIQKTPISLEISLPGGDNKFETSLYDHAVLYLLITAETLSHTEIPEEGL